MAILTAGEINRRMSQAARGTLGDQLVALLTKLASPVVNNITAATATLTAEDNHGDTITLNRAAGTTVTLPPATGSGARFEFILGTTVTSNSTIIRVTTNDIMTGQCITLQDGGDTMVGFETAADSDTITFNGSTTGGLIGTRVTLVDIALDTWSVFVVCAGTGTEATPFSATVS